MNEVKSAHRTDISNTAQIPVATGNNWLNGRLFSWFNGTKTPVTPPEPTKNAPGLLTRWGINAAAKLFGPLKRALQAAPISYRDESVLIRMQSLDKNNQLPALVESMIQFLEKSIEETPSKELGFVENIKQNTSKNALKDPEIRSALKEILIKGLANLACSSPVSKNGEEGQFLTNLIKNLSNVLNPNEGIYLKIRSMAAEEDHVISVLQTELELKRQTTQQQILKKEKQIKDLENLMNEDNLSEIVDKSNGIAKEVTELQKKLESLSKEIDQIIAIKHSYMTYITENPGQPSTFEEDEFYDSPMIEKDWFENEYFKKSLNLDFNLIFPQILEAIGISNGYAIKLLTGKLGSLIEPLWNKYIGKLNTLSTFSAEKEKNLETISGRSELSEGVLKLIQQLIPIVAVEKKEKIITFISEAAKQNIHIDPLWIENLVEALGNSKDPGLQSMLLLVAQISYPRVIRVIEHLACSQPQKGLNILEAALLNSVELLKRHLKGKETKLHHAIISYDKNGIQAKAYQACALYLQQTNTRSFNLKDENIDEILKEWSDKEIESLYSSFPNEASERRHLLSFFKYEKGKSAQEEQNETLRSTFGPLAKEFLKETGLDQDLQNAFDIEGDPVGKEKFEEFCNVNVPEYFLSFYRFFDEPEHTPGRTQKLEQVLQDFVDNFSKTAQNDGIGENLQQHKDLLAAVTKESHLSPGVIELFAKTIHRINSNWLSAIFKALEEKKFISDETQKKLAILDPNTLLPAFVDALSKVGFEQVNELIIKHLKCLPQASLIANAHAAIPSETIEFQPFVELFISKTVHRILANLAASCEDEQKNGLFSNIVKSIVSTITLENQEEFTPQGTGLETLEKILEDCRTAKNAKELRAKISASILAKADFKTASDLQLMLLPFGNANLENIVWEQINAKIPDFLMLLCEGIKYHSILPETKKATLNGMEGREKLKRDSKLLLNKYSPTIFETLAKEPFLTQISHCTKDFLDSMKIEGLDRVWITELLKKMSLSGDATIRSMREIVESIIFPRLFGALDNAAVHDGKIPTTGNFLERIITNSVNVVQNAIDGKQDILNVGTKRYDKLCLQVEPANGEIVI